MRALVDPVVSMRMGMSSAVSVATSRCPTDPARPSNRLCTTCAACIGSRCSLPVPEPVVPPGHARCHRSLSSAQHFGFAPPDQDAHDHGASRQLCPMRCGSIAHVLAKCIFKYYRISGCSAASSARARRTSSQINLTIGNSTQESNDILHRSCAGP